MIKTAVYAYWAKPFLENNSYSNFERKQDLLVSLNLSVNQARKFFDKIVFYGDHEAISQVCNSVNFDEVHDDVEQLNQKNIPNYFYVLPKVIACEKMREPFVLLENDFYLWEIPDDSVFKNAELIVEDFVDTPSVFFSEIDYMKKHDMVTRPRWYRFAKNKKMKMPLKGIYGGNNFKYINDHAHEVIKLAQNEENLKHFELSDANKNFANTHRVYDNWYLGAKFDMNKKDVFSVRSSNIKYTHLYSNKKTEQKQ